MTDIAICAAGLSKNYRVGARGRYQQRLSELFAGGWRRGKHEEFCALDEVSFEVAHGEIVGIIGSNGAGKSTLLKILSRVVRPSAGTAELHGRLASLLEVGTGFHPELSGRENIYISGIMLGMTRGEVTRRFDEIVAFSGVERFLDTPIKRYSSGMQTRLGFAVAAHLEAEILLVDEVLAVGDAEFQKKSLGKMKEVAVGGRTVLFVSHNMNSIQALCDRAIWLDKGRVRADTNDVRQVTIEYLVGGEEYGRVEWIGEGFVSIDGFVRPRTMRLIDAAGDVVTKPMPNDKELTLEIEFDLEQLDSAFNIGFALFTGGGDLLWWSYHTDGEPAAWPRLQAGRNRLRTRLPMRLLNEGRYRAELIAGLHFRNWIFPPGGGGPFLRFEISGGLSDSPFWTARRDGLLAPVLTWKAIAQTDHHYGVG